MKKCPRRTGPRSAHANSPHAAVEQIELRTQEWHDRNRGTGSRRIGSGSGSKRSLSQQLLSLPPLPRQLPLLLAAVPARRLRSQSQRHHHQQRPQKHHHHHHHQQQQQQRQPQCQVRAPGSSSRPLSHPRPRRRRRSPRSSARARRGSGSVRSRRRCGRRRGGYARSMRGEISVAGSALLRNGDTTAVPARNSCFVWTRCVCSRSLVC